MRLFMKQNMKVSERDRRTLIREASKVGKLAAQLRKSLQLPISKLRVQPILAIQDHLSYPSYPSLQKSLSLKSSRKLHWLHWAWLRHSWVPQQWRRVIFQLTKKSILMVQMGLGITDMTRERRKDCFLVGKMLGERSWFGVHSVKREHQS